MFTVKTSSGDVHSTTTSLRDAIDQADMIRGTVDFAEVHVEAGVGEDHDTGYVDSIDGTAAMVRWDSGVVTSCDTEDITAIG